MPIWLIILLVFIFGFICGMLVFHIIILKLQQVYGQVMAAIEYGAGEVRL